MKNVNNKINEKFDLNVNSLSEMKLSVVKTLLILEEKYDSCKKDQLQIS